MEPPGTVVGGRSRALRFPRASKRRFVYEPGGAGFHPTKDIESHRLLG